MIQIDQKMTVWESFSIEDDMKEALDTFLKENPDAGYYEIYNWAHENDCDPEAEIIEGTQEYLEAKDNGGEPTLEIGLRGKTYFSK